MRQEEDSKILSKLGKKSGFTTPENYFNDFAKNLAEKLPEAAVPEEKEKPNLWVRFRPYVYMAAMFAGIFCMIQVFNLFNGSSSSQNPMANGQLGGAEIVVGADSDTTARSYRDSVENSNATFETITDDLNPNQIN